MTIRLCRLILITWEFSHIIKSNAHPYVNIQQYISAIWKERKWRRQNGLYFAKADLSLYVSAIAAIVKTLFGPAKTSFCWALSKNPHIKKLNWVEIIQNFIDWLKSWYFFFFIEAPCMYWVSLQVASRPPTAVHQFPRLSIWICLPT